MGASFRPETGEERRLRIRANVQKMRAMNAPQEDVDAYLATEQVTPEQERASMPRTAMENVRGGLGSALQGATLNFSDELVGGLRGALSPSMTMAEGIADERKQLGEFREANPKTAFALEMAGGAVPAIATMGAGSAAAQSARPLLNLAKLAGAEGAVAGVGAGEGTQGRIIGGGLGGLLGFGLGAGAGKLATSRLGDALGNVQRRFSDLVAGPSGGGNLPIAAASAAPVPSAQRTAARMITPALQGKEPDLSGARRSLMDYVEGGMGDEVLGMNVGGDRAARTARVFANAPMSDAGQVLNEALARQGGALGESVAQDINVATRLGGRPGPLVLDEMRQTRRAVADDLYGKARTEADAYFQGQQAAMEWPERAMNQPLALPAPGQSAITQAELAASRSAVPQPGIPQRRQIPARTGESVGPSISADEAASLPNQRTTPRPIDVEMRAANDINVRRPPEPVAEPAPFTGRDPRVVSRLMQSAADDPVVQQSIASVREVASSPDIMNGTADDFTLLSEAYKDITAQIRANKAGIPSAQATRELAGMAAAARKIDEALTAIAPTWKQANAGYRADSELMDAFIAGQKLPMADIGEPTLALRDAPSDAAREAMRAGAATRLQTQAMERASNKDLNDLARFRDVARPVLNSAADRDRFIEMFGDGAYQVLMSRLSPKVRAAAMNAAVRGNSTTTKQLLDAMSLGDQAVLDVLESGTRGGIGAAAMNAGMRLFDPARAAVTGRFGEAATEGAKMLTARGAPQVSGMLDFLERVAREDAQRRAAVAPVAGTLTRVAVPEVP